MKKSTIQLLVIFFILSISIFVSGQSPVWYEKLNGITIPKTSKEDVEKIFSNAKISKSFINYGVESTYFESPDGKFTLRSSIGGCSFKRNDDFNVEKGKVLEIIFFPKEFVKFSKFNIKKSDFEKQMEDDNPTLHYINQDLGIDYGVQNGKVIHIKLFTPAKFENLRCDKF